MLCNGPASSHMSVSIYEALDALFRSLAGKSHPVLQGGNLEIIALGSKPPKSPGLPRVGHS